MSFMEFLTGEPAGLALVLAGAALVITLVMALHYTLERKNMTERIAFLERRLKQTERKEKDEVAGGMSCEPADGNAADDGLPPGIRFV